jgi:dipeptidyl aminopeptidase/acylaminoacyl peptidase
MSARIVNKTIISIFLLLMNPGSAAFAEISRTVTNNGNLVLEDIPEIPASVAADLNRYQNIRSAGFLDFSRDGHSIYVATRFADVTQVHRVAQPLGARYQLTYFTEPIGSVQRQPGGSKITFTMDAGGSEFSQIFLLEPEGAGDAVMLTDGRSRNNAVVWDRGGRHIAYQSTRRNGSSNDIWLMDVNNPESARIVQQSVDGSYWFAADFSPDDRKLLVTNLVSSADSRIHLLDIDSGAMRRLAGDPDRPSTNLPIAFDHDGTGFWYVTDAGSDFRQLAWQSLDEDAGPVILTGEIRWDVERSAVSDDRRRGAFTVNVEGRSELYLLDLASRGFTAVSGIPAGLVSGLEFGPNGRQLGMTLSTGISPGDSFVLQLGTGALEHGELVRWTHSEVGGLDSAGFIAPELIRYPTFDSGSGGPDSIPAWVYRPRGEAPFPVIIDIHGGPAGQARPSFSSTYQMWLAKLGAAVIRPNVRGSSGYGKHYMSLDDGFRREDSVRDIGALLDWVAGRPEFDGSRIAVVGGSYGGYMVLACAAHYSDRLSAVVDRVGISSFVTFLENTQAYRRDHRRAEYGDERDTEMRAFLHGISPVNHVGEMDVPLLIVQGQNDPRVPVTESVQMVEALRSLGRPVWYMNALNEGHGYRKKENYDVYQQVAMMFLREHLLGAD